MSDGMENEEPLKDGASDTHLGPSSDTAKGRVSEKGNGTAVAGTKPLPGRTLRRGSQPENGSRSAKLTNGSGKMTPNGGTAGQRPDWHQPNRPKQLSYTVQTAKTGSSPVSARDAVSAKSTGSPRKPPEFGKGRLERGKQISHLGLFPDTDAKRMQRQSTSMNAEAGDHPANLEDVISPNPQDKKHSLQWRQQVEHISRALMDYAEKHPQFSSQLTASRLEEIVGLKTVRPIKGSELTISVTFAVTPLMFDFRPVNSTKSSPQAKKKTETGNEGLVVNPPQKEQLDGPTANAKSPELPLGDRPASTDSVENR